MTALRRCWAGLGTGLALLLAACSGQSGQGAQASPTAAASEAPGDKPDLLLFTSLPIYWPEGGLDTMLAPDAPTHWARRALEREHDLVPIDTLAALPAQGTLLMAQPRPLSGDENVALDERVRAGERVVMIVDPMLDAHSEYGLGDKRRPAAIAMLSPILARWGLRLEEDPRGDYAAQWGSNAIPVVDGGRFVLTGKGHDSTCALVGDGLLAWCRVGKGKVVLLADATFLGDDGSHDGESAGRDDDPRAHGESAGEGGAALLADLIAAAEGPLDRL